MAGEWNLAEFKVEDLLQMAVLMQQKGYDFYSAVIEKSPERRVKNEIRFLREEEARHKVLFQEMLKKKGKSASGRLSAALDALLRREFTNPLEELISSKKIESSEEALKFGVAMEQKVVDFYAVLKDLPGASPLAADLATVSTEDQAHVSKLNAMLSY
jgi:rubrerythrin